MNLLRGWARMTKCNAKSAESDIFSVRAPIHASGRGLAVLFTGLSGAGKTTLARSLVYDLKLRHYDATLLDGDEMRAKHRLPLGFSREDRDCQARFAGELAADLMASQTIPVCAMVTPYESGRAALRHAVAHAGDLFLIHVATPLQVCEDRDPKDLYRRARLGLIQNFTGISDPYEIPRNCNLSHDTSVHTVEQSRCAILEAVLNRVAAAPQVPVVFSRDSTYPQQTSIGLGGKA